MVFAVIYWGYFHAYGFGVLPVQALEAEMAKNAALAAQKAGEINDESLWKMSTDPVANAAGKVTFEATCVACHKPDLTGLIGPNLVDNQWIHGGKPMDSFKTVNEGVLAKGMPAWGAMLGKQKMSEVVAYIFSFHKQGEEVVIVPVWTPPAIVAPPQ